MASNHNKKNTNLSKDQVNVLLVGYVWIIGHLVWIGFFAFFFGLI